MKSTSLTLMLACAGLLFVAQPARAQVDIKAIVVKHLTTSRDFTLKVADQMRSEGETVPDILAISSHGPTNGIVILEPPHRGDRPRTRWHELATNFFRIPEERLHAFEHELEELFAEYRE